MNEYLPLPSLENLKQQAKRLRAQMGVVLQEMLTGRSLFAGESVSGTLAAVLMSEPDMAALPPNTAGVGSTPSATRSVRPISC